MKRCWIDFIENPAVVRQLYSSSPKFTSMEMVEMRLHRDGPRCDMSFLTSELPDLRPPRWSVGLLRRVSIRIDLSGVKKWDMSGWNSTMVGRLEVFRTDERTLQIEFNAPLCRLSVQADSLRIASVTPVY